MTPEAHREEIRLNIALAGVSLDAASRALLEAMERADFDPDAVSNLLGSAWNTLMDAVNQTDAAKRVADNLSDQIAEASFRKSDLARLRPYYVAPSPRFETPATILQFPQREPA